MPFVIPIAAAVAGAIAAATAGAALATALGFIAGTIGAAVVAGVVGSIVAMGISMIGGALMGGPKQSSLKGLAASASNDVAGAALDRKQNVRQPVAARRLVYGWARVGGTMVYTFSFGPDQRYLGIVTVLAAHPIAEVAVIWINDEQIPLSSLDAEGIVRGGRFDGLVRVLIRDGTQTAAMPQLMADSPDGWGAAHILQGCAYMYVRLEYNVDAFSGGLQGVGATIRGKADIWDPRTGMVGYTDNWALCVLDYLRSPIGVACLPDEIDLTAFIAAANLSDEGIAIDGAGTMDWRYRADGVISLDDSRREIIAQLLTAGAGTLVYVQGQYRLYGGAYTAPTDTLTASDLAGSVRVTNRPPRRELFNAVKGTFIDPSRYWQASEFPAVIGPVYEAEDGERLWREVGFTFTRDPLRAQRLARMELLRGREALTIEAPVQYRGIRYAVWQMLAVSIPDLGVANKPMRIISWSFQPPSGEDGPLLTLRLREESPAAYAWAWYDASIPAPAPDTTLASPLSVAAPAGLGVTEELYATRDGVGVQTRALLSWSRVASVFVIGYDIQYRVVGGDWRQAPGTLGETRTAIDALADGLYEFRVRARTSLTSSAWATLQARIGILAALPPAQVTGLAVQSIGGFAYLGWHRHPDIDVRNGGRIEIRHTPDDVTPSWSGSTSIGTAVPGDATFAVVPLKAGAYLLKAVDAGGRRSLLAAVIRSSQATALPYAAVASLTEHPDFSGATSGTIVVDDVLRLDAGGMIDAEPDWDAIADLDMLGGVLPEGRYAFSGGLDLGSVRPVRLTGHLVASVVNTLDQVDGRSSLVSEWPDWDGVVGGEADAWIEVRGTAGDPDITDTWSDWRRLDAAEFRARGFEFRAELRSYDPTMSIHVTELSVAADEVT